MILTFRPARPDLAYRIRRRMEAEWKALTPCGRWHATDRYAREGSRIPTPLFSLAARIAATAGIVGFLMAASLVVLRMRAR